MPDRTPPFTALRAVEAAARHRSFTSAARELNVTHSAVSQAVKRLECDLGVELFARRGGGMVPSDAALRLAQTYSGAAESLSLLIREISGETSPDLLQLAVPAEFQALWLTPRAARMRAALPDFSVSTTELTGPAEMMLERANGAAAGEALAPVRIAAAWRGDILPRPPVEVSDLRQGPPLMAVSAGDATAWRNFAGENWPDAQVVGAEAVVAAVEGQALVVADALLLEPLLARGELVAWPQQVSTTASLVLRARVGPGKAAMADRLRLWFQLEIASTEASLRRVGLRL